MELSKSSNMLLSLFPNQVTTFPLTITAKTILYVHFLNWFFTLLIWKHNYKPQSKQKQPKWLWKWVFQTHSKINSTPSPKNFFLGLSMLFFPLLFLVYISTLFPFFHLLNLSFLIPPSSPTLHLLLLLLHLLL